MGTLRALQAAYTSVGDENVVLAWVDDEVGWGIFAAKDFAQGNGPAHIGAGTRPHGHTASPDARSWKPVPAQM